MKITSALLLLLAACSSEPAVPSPTAPAPTASAATPASTAAPTPASGMTPHDGGEHAHKSPHGGIVKTVGDKHVEALMMPTGVLFYLSDEAEKPLPVDGYTGTVVVKGPSGVSTVPLMAMGDHLHAATTLTQGQPASVVVTLSNEGKAISASFETKTVGLEAHDHTSLHGGQVGMWGEHHLEYAPEDGSYRVWISDEHRNPVTTAASVSVKDGDQTVPLALDATSGMFSAPGEGAGTRPVMVDVKMGTESFSLAFNPTMETPGAKEAGSKEGGHDHADGDGHH